MSLKNWIGQITNYGVSNTEKFSIQRKIRLSNQIFLSVQFVLIPIGLAWFYFGEYLISSIILGLSPLFVLGLFLNKIGFHYLSRCILIIFCLIVSIFTTDFIGPEGGTQFYFFTVLVGTYGLFDYTEKGIRYILTFGVVLSFLLIHTCDYDLISEYRVAPEITGILFYFNTITAFGVCIAVLSVNLKFVSQDEELLLSKNKKLAEMSEVMSNTQKDLSENQIRLEGAINEAENALKIKSEFLSNMSHEIRTPMNSVMGFSELLLEQNNLNENDLQYVESIKKSTNHLLVIVNDILDFSKLESGKLKLEKIHFSIKDEIQSLSQQLELKAKSKDLQFNTNIDPDLSEWLIGDPIRLKQILMNLCDNAIKFTKDGEINVEVRVVSSSINSQRIKFSVSDTGIGIPNEMHDAIFESFNQGQSNTTRSYGGTGLGLAIAKELVLLNNGKINLESTSGVGSVFSFEIEYLISNDKQSVVNKEVDIVKYINGVNILTAEDNEMNRLLIDQFFKRWGVKNTFANNGQEAVILSDREEYDIILMDLQMPIKNGFEALNEIRNSQNNKNSNTPVIAVTADAFPDTEKKVLASGFQGFVSKPINKNELLISIHQLVQSKS